MVNLNRVFLMGNLTRDPELRYTASGASLASFGLAINRRYKQGEDIKEEVCFVDIIVWGKQAESCSEHLNKGRGVFIEGRLHYRTWESEEGQKRSKVEVVATSVQFLPRSGNQSQTNSGHSESSSPSPEEAMENDNKISSGVADDIPF